MFNYAGKNYIGKISQIKTALQSRPQAPTGIYARIGTGPIGKLLARPIPSESTENAEPV